MFSKKLLLISIFIAVYSSLYAQTDDFCNALTTIARDGINKFRNIKGKSIKSGSSAMAWECGIKVPGTIKSRFVASNGLFYEGALFQTFDKNEVKAAYDKYKEQLSNCLVAQGYKLSTQDNFYPGLSAYKKLVYMPEIKEDTRIEDVSSHITMETTYSKDIKKYTIVVYIFEH